MEQEPEKKPATSTVAFVGREREMAELRLGLEEVNSGRGRLFLIVGEPGIGKTRIAEEFAGHAASRGAQVAWGRCWREEGTPAYWPWSQILRIAVASFKPNELTALLGPSERELSTIVPELRRGAPAVESRSAPPAEAEQARFRLFESVAKLLAHWARQVPVVLIFDDLHDADLPSFMLLRFVARELKGERLFLLGTHRETEVRNQPNLKRLMGEISREGMRFSLVGLDKGQLARMVAESTGQKPGDELVSTLHRATLGNPLFVDGVVRILLAEGGANSLERLASSHDFHIPEGLREATRRRLSCLSEDANTILKSAAAVGEEFDLSLLNRVTGITDEQLLKLLDEAEAAGVLIRQPGVLPRYRFCHGLIQQALYEEFPILSRLQMHRAIGEAMEERHRAEPDLHLTEIAYHFVQAAQIGNSDKAIEYSVRAGEAAYAAFAYEKTASHWESALRLMERSGRGAEQIAQLLERLAGVMGIIDLPKSIEYLERTLHLYEKLGRMDRAGVMHAQLGAALSLRSSVWNIPRAMDHFRRAEAILRSGPETEALALLYIGICQACEQTVDIAQGLTASANAMVIGERLGNDAIWTAASAQHGVYLMRDGQISKAFALLDRAWSKADRLNLGFAVARQGGYLRLALWDPWGADRWYQRELANARTNQAPFLREILVGASAMARAFAGEVTKVQASASTALRQGLAAGLIAWYSGEWERAEQILLEGLSHSRGAGSGDDQANYLYFLARVLRSCDRLAQAESLMEEALALSPDGRHRQWQMMMRPDLALICGESGRLEEAAAHLARCGEIAGAGEENWHGLAGHFAQAKGFLDGAAGHPEEADKSFATAVEILRRYHAPWEEAETFLYWGRALTSSGDTARSLEKFDEAIAVYSRLGAAPRWAERTARYSLPLHPLSVDAHKMSHRDAREHPVEAASQAEAVLIKEGDYWNIGYGGKFTRLRDLKGFWYLGQLLRNPNRELHAVDLATIGETATADASSTGNEPREIISKMGDVQLEKESLARGDLGDAGEMLDAKAKDEYRRRRQELLDEIEEARELGDHERAARAEDESEALARELARAVGLRGRDRRAASSSERARIGVQRAVKAAVDRVAESNPALARILTKTIRTGTFCSYVPDPSIEIVWRLSDEP